MFLSEHQTAWGNRKLHKPNGQLTELAPSLTSRQTYKTQVTSKLQLCLPSTLHLFFYVNSEGIQGGFLLSPSPNLFLHKEGRKETKSNGFAKTTEKNYLNKLSLHLISCPPHYFTATFKERAHSF